MGARHRSTRSIVGSAHLETVAECKGQSLHWMLGDKLSKGLNWTGQTQMQTHANGTAKKQVSNLLSQVDLSRTPSQS